MTVLMFFLILFTLILVHEFGHFIVAKLFKIRVDEFALGFPPRLFAVKKGETEYAFNLLPIGGYVKIFGEDPDEQSLTGPDSNRSLANAPKYVQALVMVAGVAMNVLLAWVTFSVGYMVGMPGAVTEHPRAIIEDRAVIIAGILPESPAADAGLEPGDELLSITSKRTTVPVTGGDQAIPVFQASDGTPLALQISRAGEALTLEVTPEKGLIPNNPDTFGVGVVMTDAGIISYPWYLAPVEGLKLTKDLIVSVFTGIISFIGSAFSFEAKLSDISGPVGIATLVGDASAQGWIYVLQFAALISLNLAVINLLPLPALDGGRLVMVGIEAITRRRISSKIANAVNGAGIVALLGLMALITISDVLKLI